MAKRPKQPPGKPRPTAKAPANRAFENAPPTRVPVERPRVKPTRARPPLLERVTVSSILDSGAPVSGVTLDPKLRLAGLIPGVNIGGVAAPIGPITAPPLALLPMRLEYRIVTAAAPPVVADVAAQVSAFEKLSRTSRASKAVRRVSQAARLALQKKILRQQLATQTLAFTASRTEIWFRFYPDGNFAHKGIRAVSEAERAKLLAFRGRVGARPAFDLDDPETLAAWTELAAALGPHRALELLRRSEADFDRDSVATTGQIALLPAAVSLYAVNGDQVALLGTGRPIPANTSAAPSAVRYTPEATEPGGWMRDFPLALSQGMALKLTEPNAVARALAADSVIAIGQHPGSAQPELLAFTADGIANGTIAFVPQDTPTNNGPNSPTPLRDPLLDLPRFVAEAAADERGALPAGGTSAADHFATAFDLDPALLRKAVAAGDQGFADARAMLRVIGPALLDGALDGVTAVSNVDENAFVEILASAFAARGALAAMRFGADPYGVLPVVDLAALDTTDPDPKTRAVHDFLVAYARIVRSILPSRAEQNVSVLTPDDPHAAAKLEDILKNNRVSTRIVAADETDTKTASIGCSYVTGTRPEDEPARYLAALRTRPLKELADPTETEPHAPLLYRLARLSLTSNVFRIVLEATRLKQARTLAAKTRVSTRLETDAVLRRNVEGTGLLDRSVNEMLTGSFGSVLGAGGARYLQQIQRSFLEALLHLESIARRPQGTALLEVLLMEVIDLFQHRVDAWATGLAYQQLVKLRNHGLRGVAAGYYGFLGKLRAPSAPHPNGFIPAPSMAQATTAAILRSAFLRHAGQGAFELDLSSRRVRRALGVLEILRKGIAIEEAFGMRGERWLHDHGLSRFTLRLRERFPFVNPTGADSANGEAEAGIRVFDGLAFLNDSLLSFSAGERQALGPLKVALAADLDALSDIVVAEAAHQRGMGQSAAAKAWMNVLSGGSIPGDPAFLRTRRIGQGSSYRVSFVFPVAPAPSPATPREIAEPVMAAAARAAITGFSSLRTEVTIERVRDPSQRHRFELSLANDLGLSPLDLVIGGQSELAVRVRHQAISSWLRDPSFRAALGGIAPEGLRAFVDGEARIGLGDTTTGPKLSLALTRALGLRELAQRGRPLEPSDLNAAAGPANLLDEAAEVALTAAGVSALRSRALSLQARLDGVRAVLAGARSAFVASIRPIRQALDTSPPLPVTAAALSTAELARRALEAARRAVAAFNEPAALRHFTLEEAIADPDRVDETGFAIEARLAEKSRTLADAVAGTIAPAPARLEEARAQRRTLVQALQAALDGESLRILTPFARNAATTPLTDPPVNVAAALAPWHQVRKTIATALGVSATLPGVRAHRVTAAATGANPGANDEPRSEAEAPNALHFGVILAAPSTLGQAEYAGLVCDEWSEQRPSITQPAALAINYDAPGAEAPNCILLCVPPNDRHSQWTNEALASLVNDTFAWSKVRALSTDQKPWPAAFLPKANQVPSKAGERRIPRRSRNHFLEAVSAFEAAFSVVADEAPLGSAKTTWNERSGFSSVKE